MAWIGAAIAAAAALGSAWLSHRSSKKQNEKTIKAQKDMAEYQYSKELEMWNKQNEYNTPENQMLRYKDAGLSPNLIYSQGSSGNATSMPHYQAPTVNYRYTPMQIPEIIGTYYDLALKKAQVDNVTAQTRNVEERTQNESIRSWLLDLQGRTGEFKLDKDKQLLPHQAQVLEGEARQAEAKVEQSWAQLQLMRREDLIKLLDAQNREQGITTQQLQQEQIRAETMFKQNENEWRKMGVTSGDNPLLRILSRMLLDAGFSRFKF